MKHIRSTSICHCKNSNYQIDYSGFQHDCVEQFECWCLKNDVVWAHLFNEQTAEMVATFNRVQGLTTLAV